MPAVLYHLGQFPPPVLDWPQLIPLLGPSSAAVARYDGKLAAVPNAAVLRSPLTIAPEYPNEGVAGGWVRGSGQVHRKPVCGSLLAETEPHSALSPTGEPQRLTQSEDFKDALRRDLCAANAPFKL